MKLEAAVAPPSCFPVEAATSLFPLLRSLRAARTASRLAILRMARVLESMPPHFHHPLLLSTGAQASVVSHLPSLVAYFGRMRGQGGVSWSEQLQCRSCHQQGRPQGGCRGSWLAGPVTTHAHQGKQSATSQGSTGCGASGCGASGIGPPTFTSISNPANPQEEEQPLPGLPAFAPPPSSLCSILLWVRTGKASQLPGKGKADWGKMLEMKRAGSSVVMAQSTSREVEEGGCLQPRLEPWRRLVQPAGCMFDTSGLV